MISIDQHSPEVWLMDRIIPFQSLWIQENKLCQQVISMIQGTRKSIPYPHCPMALSQLFFKDEMPHKKMDNHMSPNFLCYHPIYVIKKETTITLLLSHPC